MKKVIITQSNYIPWKGYFDAINMADEFIIYDDMQYTRRDWRNRNKIKTQDGVKWLTIPVKVKGKYFQKINETRLSDPNWGEAHWKIISQNYSGAPYFNEYSARFEALYLDRNRKTISEVNYDFITVICDILGITTRIRWSGEFELEEGRTERLIGICQETGATDYYTGPSSRDYIDEQLFEKAGIKLHYIDYHGYPPYRQLFGAFKHQVSIIDLIFNEGENATQYMKSFQTVENEK